MPSYKIAKISMEVRQAISEILFESARDSLLKSVTITDAKVSKDLSYAKIYFTSLSDLSKEKIVKEVNEASTFIRGRLAQKLNLRHTPILEFIYDDSIEYANRIEKKLEEIHENK